MQSTVDPVDLGHEQSDSMLAEILHDERAWLAAQVTPADCIISLEDDALAEIRPLSMEMRRTPLPLLLRAPEQFHMPALVAFMAKVKAQLDGPLGIAVIDRLPLDDLEVEETKAIFWMLGRLIGRPVAQKWDGTMLYDVTDTGQSYSYGVRGSYTNVELVFHTDNAFAVSPPDYVGLMCLSPAMRGGVSRFCSLHAVHNRMLASHPGELERLYRCVLWDRQAEHAPDAPRVAWAPMFRYADERLSARVNVSLVRKGYEVVGRHMDEETADALAALESVADDPALWFELPIECGQLQYLNNRQIAHYRSAFHDHSDPAHRRHLVRTWHRDSGLPSYDG
jgi:alpha-ketoglutarate-dependent taurine dioxygenase